MGKLQKLLSRRTNSLDYIPEIDGFRFLAISSVVIFHICEFLQFRIYAEKPEIFESSAWFWTAKHGAFGVELFFVISGFILSLPFIMASAKLRGPIGLKAYYLRRVTRLEPPYIINLALILIPYAWLKGYELVDLLPHFVARLFYCHNLIYPNIGLISPVTWSLEIEIQFYLLVPFLIRLFDITRVWLRRLIMMGVAIGAVIAQNTILPASFPLTLIGFIQYFLMGFILADIYVNDWGLSPVKSHRWDAAALGSLGLIAGLFVWGGEKGVALLPFAVLLLYACIFKGRFMSQAASHSWIPIIGGMCYTIYLYHYQIIYFLAPRLTPWISGQSFAWSLTVCAMVLCPIILGLCGVLFVLIERPCMDRHWPNRLWNWLRGRNQTGTLND